MPNVDPHPAGPRVHTILTSQAEHRSSWLWDGPSESEGIPVNVDTSTTLYKIILQGKHERDWVVEHAPHIAKWVAHTKVVDAPPFDREMKYDDEFRDPHRLYVCLDTGYDMGCDATGPLPSMSHDDASPSHSQTEILASPPLEASHIEEIQGERIEREVDRPYDDKFPVIYNFLWDRRRAIRIELRMQHISNQGAIVMLEQMLYPQYVALLGV
nr:sac3 family protein b [Quercus suber]